MGIFVDIFIHIGTLKVHLTMDMCHGRMERNFELRSRERFSYAQYPVTGIDQLKGGYHNYVKRSVGNRVSVRVSLLNSP